MQVSRLPKEALERLRSKGMTLPNRCFANCASIVFNLKLGNYILCWVIDECGEEHPHAVIERDGIYYDPTLQDICMPLFGYRLVKSLSRDELISEMINSGAIYNNLDDTIIGLPPALLMDGTIVCKEVQSL